MQLELCSDITRLFDNKEFIKIFDETNNKETIKEENKNQYYIFKIDNNYYGIDKEFYNNKFVNIEYLIKMRKIKEIECIDNKLNSKENEEKLINKLENRILVQAKIKKLQNKFGKIENNISILKTECRLEVIKVNKVIKYILAKKEENNKRKNIIKIFIGKIKNIFNDKRKNDIEILIEKIELLSKKGNGTTEILNKADIKLIDIIDELRSILCMEKLEKPGIGENSKIIDYLKNSNSKLKEDSKKINNFTKRIKRISKKIPNFEKNFKNYVNRYKKQEKLLNQDFNKNYEIALESIGKIYADMENDKKFNKIDKLIKDIDLKYPNLIKEDLMEMEDLIKKIREYDIQIKKNESEIKQNMQINERNSCSIGKIRENTPYI